MHKVSLQEHLPSRAPTTTLYWFFSWKLKFFRLYFSVSSPPPPQSPTTNWKFLSVSSPKKSHLDQALEKMCFPTSYPHSLLKEHLQNFQVAPAKERGRSEDASSLFNAGAGHLPPAPCTGLPPIGRPTLSYVL